MTEHLDPRDRIHRPPSAEALPREPRTAAVPVREAHSAPALPSAGRAGARRRTLGRTVMGLGLAAALVAGDWQTGAAPQLAALVTAPLGGTADATGTLASAATGSGTAAGASRTTGSGTPAGTNRTSGPEEPAGAVSAGHSAATASTSGTRTVTGDAVTTRYGTVQVAAVMDGSKLVSVSPLQWTDFPRYVTRVSSVLPREVLSAQSAHVAVVSGATYTSEGYLQSLQSALDRAQA